MLISHFCFRAIRLGRWSTVNLALANLLALLSNIECHIMVLFGVPHCNTTHFMNIIRVPTLAKMGPCRNNCDENRFMHIGLCVWTAPLKLKETVISTDKAGT